MSATAMLERSALARDAAFTRCAAAVATLYGAQVVHVFVMEDHFQEWFVSGMCFLALSLAEGLAAAGLILRPSQRSARIVLWLSVGTVALWLLSRTAGLPIGPHPFVPEPVGRADAIATLLESATVVALAPLARAWPVALSQRVGGERIAVVAVIGAVTAALTIFAISGPGGHA